jgi:hypothetical protein
MVTTKESFRSGTVRDEPVIHQDLAPSFVLFSGRRELDETLKRMAEDVVEMIGLQREATVNDIEAIMKRLGNAPVDDGINESTEYEPCLDPYGSDDSPDSVFAEKVTLSLEIIIQNNRY